MRSLESFTRNAAAPAPTQAVAMLEAKKAAFEAGLERCHSRLEAIELLNSNSKHDDSWLLARSLTLDAANLILTFHDRATVADIDQIEAALAALPNPFADCVAIFGGNPAWRDHLCMPTATAGASMRLERSLAGVLRELERAFARAKKGPLRTPRDTTKRRVRFVVGSLVLLALTALSTLIYHVVQYPALKRDYAQLYYLTGGSAAPTEANSVRLDLQLAPQWTTYTFQLPRPVDITSIRIDPMNQKNVRVQFKDLRIWDASGTLLKERDFVVQENLHPRKPGELGIPDQFRDVENVPGGYWTLISWRVDPSIQLKTGPLENVSVVEVTFRVVEEYKHFED